MKTANAFQPKAHPANVCILGKARFTFLTDRMVRMEWTPDATFEDRATLAVCNRALPRVAWRKHASGPVTVLSTSALRIEYRADGRPFCRTNLRASFALNGRTVTWSCGEKDRQNLRGTTRTLDGAWGGKNWKWKKDKDGNWVRDKYTTIDLGTGLISRTGWAVVDDSANIVLDPDLVPGRLWVKARPDGKRQDLYLLAYGHDYTAALRDAATVFGRQPLPPRFAFGYWYSKYWAYTDKEIEALVKDFDTLDVPLDVMVIDMDWHLPGWTGYTWDKRYFPDPARFLKWLKSRDLKITLNLHPADGVADHEEAFPAMCRALGVTGKPRDELPDNLKRWCERFGRDLRRVRHIPFKITDPKYMDAYFKHLHHPHEKMGTDFWWMDWQQGMRGSDIAGLNPLPWLNHLHWEDQEQHSDGRRPIDFSRFGGLGSGRYPIGFSGDTVIAWQSLAYQPYFTATASNVLYGYWSHDIGGHFKAATDPEMYLRWLQFGIYSPILRTHVSKSLEAERRVWKFPDPYAGLMATCIRQRYEMLPYIYTEARKAFDTGISLLRPMYYRDPEEPAAYEATGQYRFGDHLLVAPATQPRNAKTDLTRVRVWLPAGTWIDTAQGDQIRGGRWIERDYMLSETPVFVKPGTVIPGQANARRITPGSYRNLVVTVYPGASGAYDLYEDDGITQGYLSRESAIIPIRYLEQGTTRMVKLGPARGRFKGFAPKRSLEVRLPFAVPPSEVTVGGRVFRWSLEPQSDTWSYDGASTTLVIRVKQVDVTRGVQVRIRFPAGTNNQLVWGLKGRISRLEAAATLERLVSPVHPLCAEERLATEAAQTGNRISRNPSSFVTEVQHLRRILRRLPDVLKTFRDAYRAKGGRDAPQLAILDRARALAHEAQY